jgi:short-subunit dehydrogenase
MRREIAGLRVIVTGASSGIGYELALQLVRSGAKVLAVARREERLAKLLAAAGTDRLKSLVGDVTDAVVRRRALELAEAEFGGLDALVNNAGKGGPGPFAEASPARLRELMEVNFFAPAEFVREALPWLRKGRAPIVVNIGSVLGHRAVPNKSEYCASKFALHGLNDALRIELQREGIDVLLVSPSTTASEFFEAAERSRGGDGPTEAPPPVRRRAMTPEKVAARTIAAMRSGRREIILSAGGKALVWLDRLCPPFADWVLTRWG